MTIRLSYDFNENGYELAMLNKNGQGFSFMCSYKEVDLYNEVNLYKMRLYKVKRKRGIRLG